MRRFGLAVLTAGLVTLAGAATSRADDAIRLGTTSTAAVSPESISGGTDVEFAAYRGHGGFHGGHHGGFHGYRGYGYYGGYNRAYAYYRPWHGYGYGYGYYRPFYYRPYYAFYRPYYYATPPYYYY